MKSRKLHLPSPAMVIAIIALIAATTGSAVAASSLITSAKIKNGTIKLADISKSTQKALKKGKTGPQGPKGDKGDTGAAGAAGAPGAPGTALAYARVAADGTLDTAHSSANLTPAMVTNAGTSASCWHNLPFTVHHVVATAEYNGGPTSSPETVQVALAGAGFTSDCAGVAGTVLEVAGDNGTAYAREPYYILFN
jgi:hypothetical protein